MIVFGQPAISVLDVVSIMALQLSRESYFVFPDSTLIEVKPSHSGKIPCPMLVTLLGMVIEVRLLQPWKTPLPMLVTLLGMVIEVRPVQYSKAEASMLVTPLTIVTEVKP